MGDDDARNKETGPSGDRILYGDFPSGRPAPLTLEERLRELDLSDLSSPYHFEDLGGFSGTDSWAARSLSLPACLKAQLGMAVSPGASGDMPGTMLVEGTWARLQQIAERGPLKDHLSVVSFEGSDDGRSEDVVPSISVYNPVGSISRTLRLAIEEMSGRPDESWWLYRRDRRSIYYSDGEQLLGWIHRS